VQPNHPPQQLLQPMENNRLMYLETHESFHKTFMVSFQEVQQTQQGSFPFILLSRLLLELGLIVLLEAACTLDAT